MPTIVIDLDGTLCDSVPGGDYSAAIPIPAVVDRLREYKAKGFSIAIHTARNMRSFQGSIGKINAVTLPVVIEWLRAHEIPYDEVYVGKPWCGKGGFYVCDKTIRPEEFVEKSYEDILRLVKEEAPQ